MIIEIYKAGQKLGSSDSFYIWIKLLFEPIFKKQGNLPARILCQFPV